MIPSREDLLAFSIVAALLTVTPGADTMLVIRNVIRSGRSAGFVTAVGICSGVLIHAALSAVGLSIVLAQSAVAFHAVKMLGALYLIWLGVQSLLDARRRADETDPPPRSRVTARRSLTEGFLSNLLNPKVSVFYLAFLPQFIDPDRSPFAASLFLAGLHFLMGIVWLGLVAIFVARGRTWFARSRVRKWLEGLAGTVLVTLGVRLLLERRTS